MGGESRPRQDADGCSAFYLIDDYGPYTPASPNGTVLRNHLLALKAATAGGGDGGGGGGGTGGGQSPTAAPAAVGPGTKTPIAILKFATTGITDGKTVTFTVDAGHSCSGSISGQSTKPTATDGKKPKKLALGSVEFTLAANKSTKVTLKLSAAARVELQTTGSLRGAFTLSVSSPGSAASNRSLSKTLKKASGRNDQIPRVRW